MRILITNDDGINAPVLPHFVRWAKQLGDVTVVAPKYEQSGKSQAIDFHREVEIKRTELPAECEAWVMDSTPADCVRFATAGLGRTYDLVLSGINCGYNLGQDIVYSGTIGATFESARIGIKAIAFSTDFDDFDTALTELDGIYEFIREKQLLSHASVLNINIPTTPSRGICVTRQGGIFYTDRFEAVGNDMFRQVGEPLLEPYNDLGVDIHAIRSGYISISPLTEKRTDDRAYELIKNI